MQDNEFDDISDLLNEVLEGPTPEQETVVEATNDDVIKRLDDGAVTTPEAPKSEVTVETHTPNSDDEILGDFLNQIADETVNEALSSSAPEPAKSGSEPLEVDAIENEIAAITGEVENLPKVEGDKAEAAGVGGDLTQVCKTQEHVFAKPIEASAIQLPTFTSDELADSIDIRNFGTLVTLNTRRWHAKVKDNKAAKDAADKAGASPEAFEARKRLLAGCDAELKAVHKEIDTARTEHYRLTMPWSSVGVNDIGKRDGGRLMPNTLFLEYTTVMAKCKASMEAKLALFETKYPSLIAVAQQKLGSAFNPSEYPNPSSIRDHFSLSFDFNPIPVGEDFKGLQQAQVEKLSAALKRKTRAMLENAMQDVWKTLYETVQHAHARLAKPGAMFHASLIDKLRDQATLMKHLNATGDKNIAQVANLISGDLIKFDPKDIRKDDALRKRLADYAEKIVKFMEGVANA